MSNSNKMIQPYRINNCKFQQSMISFLSELHESKAYTDVVLHAEGKLLNAHRVVLAAGSGYFNSLFSTLPSTPSQSLVVALPNVKYKDLEQVVKFIYHGYVDIVDSQLENFVSLAKELRVVGMIDDDDDDDDEDNNSTPVVLTQQQPTTTTTPVSEPIVKTEEVVVQQQRSVVTSSELLDHQQQQGQHFLLDDDDDDDDVENLMSYTNDESNELDFDDEFEVDFEVDNKSTLNPGGSSGGGGAGGGSNMNTTTTTTNSGEKPFVCLKCGKTYNSNKSLWRHKKFTCDEKIEFTCEICGKVFSRSDNLRRHVVVAHHQN